ncbi:hypothetical protein N7471_010468 [Penicillium samsonianum]|uniref:uncharacterized protein n=1 Tax=Penicillium samsonianum TaxID=1882272 RepID=UPI00254939E1|nr:uncharacterized protein N7471_010468 [Penicillium samsonianum]KAJ6125975.1 hypothetical protein N7471_010468 [Penicillium samsonianum]
MNDICSRYLTSQQHQQKHYPRNMECYGCYQTFKTFSVMVIHLESGNCESEVTEDEIDDIAHDCFQSRKYIDDDIEGGGWNYACPSCSKDFSKLSALYQHAEDAGLCSHSMKGQGCLAKLERFIASRLR